MPSTLREVRIIRGHPVKIIDTYPDITPEENEHRKKEAEREFNRIRRAQIRRKAEGEACPQGDE